MTRSRFQRVDAKAAAATLGRTTRALREWAKKGFLGRRYGDDNKVYDRIETPRNEGGKGGSKGEVNAEMHPELYRQIAGERWRRRIVHAERPARQSS